MKTLHTIRQLALVTCLSMLTMAATGQRETRQDLRNGSDRPTTRTESSERSRDNVRVRPAKNTTSRQGREQYTRNEGRDSYKSKGHPSRQNNNSDYKRNNNQKGNDRQYKRDNARHGQNNKHSSVHKPASAHVHYSQPKPVYHYKHLPTKRGNRFHYNGYEYYHSNNHFYRHHPHHGYHIVEAPFTRVRYLPARYQVRVYNGYSYPYYKGYFFLPAEYGYVMVPAPARPQMSFNILLNL